MRLKILLIVAVLINMNPSCCADRLSKSSPDTEDISLLSSIQGLWRRMTRSTTSLPTAEDTCRPFDSQKVNSASYSSDEGDFSGEEDDLDAFFEESQKVGTRKFNSKNFEFARKKAFPGSIPLSLQKQVKVAQEANEASKQGLDINVDRESIFYRSTIKPTSEWYKQKEKSLLHRSLK